MTIEITGAEIACCPELNEAPMYRVKYQRDGKRDEMLFRAQCAITAQQVASERLCIPFRLHR